MAEEKKVPRLLEEIESQLDRREEEEKKRSAASETGVQNGFYPSTSSAASQGGLAGPIEFGGVILEPRPTRGIRQEVCRHWLKGGCMKKENCEFLHQLDKDKMPICPYPYVMCPMRERCIYKHPDRDRQNTYKEKCPFYEKGYCKNGLSCKHRHEPKQICPNYVYGFCPEGPDCRYSHPPSPISDEDDSLERLAFLIEFKKLWPYSSIPVWYIDRVCHKCGETGHSYKECPFAHLETSGK